MEYFAQYQENYLRKYIELKNGIPSHDTMQRVFGMISPDIISENPSGNIAQKVVK